MLFNSINFFIFFIITISVFYCIPKKVQFIWLLIVSYFFYMNWSVKYTLLLVMSTVITYSAGAVIGHINNKTNNDKAKKTVVFLCIFLNLSMLFYFKYLDFALTNIKHFFSYFGYTSNIKYTIPLLPVGISFYIFQALGYTIDVYRKQVNPEKNFFKYALFVSFFPQLVAGPIEKSRNLLVQIDQEKKFDIANFKEGFYLVLWGFFMKIVVADRISVVVDTVYNIPSDYSGTILAIASVLFAFQIYCDFAGYSIIAMGTAKMLGFNLMENFNAPYLAESINDFWKRWHISLTGWFRDYLYVPLGGNKKGTIRKLCNLLIVFLVSGLWHGASWTYVIWGGLNGVYRITEILTEKVREKISNFLNINVDNLGNHLIRVISTFCLIDFTWIFFRARGVTDAFLIIRKIATDFTPWIFTDNTLYTLGLDEKNFTVMILGIVLIITVDLCKKNGVVIRNTLQRQNYWFRCLTLVFCIMFLLIFGIWGPNYDASGFIYFQF